MTLTPRKLHLIRLLEQKIIATPHPDGLPLETEKERLFAFFRDMRPTGSMQLTDYGFEILRQSFKRWEITLKEPLTVGDHVYLTRAAPSPYHLDGLHLTTFNGSFGTVMILTDGCMEKIRMQHQEKSRKKS